MKKNRSRQSAIALKSRPSCCRAGFSVLNGSWVSKGRNRFARINPAVPQKPRRGKGFPGPVEMCIRDSDMPDVFHPMFPAPVADLPGEAFREQAADQIHIQIPCIWRRLAGIIPQTGQILGKVAHAHRAEFVQQAILIRKRHDRFSDDAVIPHRAAEARLVGEKALECFRCV